MVRARESAVWFDTAAEWRRWLGTNHATATECWVGLRKKHVRTGIDYAEALDEALCFGWIDGITHSVDADGYTIRFSPRKARSIWSAVNLKRMEELEAEGRLAEAGRVAWQQRDPEREGLYSHEQADVAFDADMEARFQSNDQAWAWFSAQTPTYQRQATWWVVSAKRPETRERRLASLIEESAASRRVRHLA